MIIISAVISYIVCSIFLNYVSNSFLSGYIGGCVAMFIISIVGDVAKRLEEEKKKEDK
jgi:hypothetical protein